VNAQPVVKKTRENAVLHSLNHGSPTMKSIVLLGKVTARNGSKKIATLFLIAHPVIPHAVIQKRIPHANLVTIARSERTISKV